MAYEATEAQSIARAKGSCELGLAWGLWPKLARALRCDAGVGHSHAHNWLCMWHCKPQLHHQHMTDNSARWRLGQESLGHVRLLEQGNEHLLLRIG